MARHDSPPDSPLSSMAGSSEYPEDQEPPSEEGRPLKRPKLNHLSRASSAAIVKEFPSPLPHPLPEHDTLEGVSPVSSDTDGDVPSSPLGLYGGASTKPWDDDDMHEQVTRCEWDGCEGRDFGNMDKLVEHIHAEHIDGRTRVYTCEWMNCVRKSLPHASGYALKAHMRSHTREKPFYCYLPECERAFTRSDALAKHMRTVHETEALRPSDPVPKSMQNTVPNATVIPTAGPTDLSSKSSSKLKIILRTAQPHALGEPDTMEDGDPGAAYTSAASDYPTGTAGAPTDQFTPLAETNGFSAHELSMPVERLFRLCKAQQRWATREAAELARECKHWEEVYKREWLDKEVLLDQVVESEQIWDQRRAQVRSGWLDVQVTGKPRGIEPSMTDLGTGVAEDGTPEVEGV